MLTNNFNRDYDEGKSLEPLNQTHKPASDWLLFMPFFRAGVCEYIE